MLRARAKASNKRSFKASKNKVPKSKASKRRAAKSAPDSSGMRRCALPARTVRPLSADVMANPVRASAILISQSKWMSGTVLHYCFFTKGPFAVPKKQAAAVRSAFAKWKSIGIGLLFKEVKDLREAEVRIGYSVEGDTSYSSVGRAMLEDPLSQPTTVYGWSLLDKNGRSTALHEIGHVLGMEHEHQNPNAGIEWHEEEVYKSLEKSDNWTRKETFDNIISKLAPDQVQGSKWDPASIMEYQFDPGLIAKPERYETEGVFPPGTISAADRKWVRKWYPPVKKYIDRLLPHKPALLDLAPGAQANFLIEPSSSRKFTIETKGASDAVLVLFEVIDGSPRYVSGDDDSGEDRSAAISYKLFNGRQYVARLRLVHPGPTGQVSLMYS
jgi:hypothetical protein